MFAMLKASNSYHRLRKNGNIYTRSLPDLHAHTAWIIFSALINSKMPIANAFHYFMLFMLFIRIAFQIKLTRWVSVYI